MSLSSDGMRLKKRHPVFKRPGLGRYKRLHARWRRPRGIDSKQRIHLKWAGARPSIGYRGPRALRGLHSSGAREVIVSNVKEVAQAPIGCVLRIASRVGQRRRRELLALAAQRGLRVLNP